MISPFMLRRGLVLFFCSVVFLLLVFSVSTQFTPESSFNLEAQSSTQCSGNSISEINNRWQSCQNARADCTGSESYSASYTKTVNGSTTNVYSPRNTTPASYNQCAGMTKSCSTCDESDAHGSTRIYCKKHYGVFSYSANCYTTSGGTKTYWAMSCSTQCCVVSDCDFYGMSFGSGSGSGSGPNLAFNGFPSPEQLAASEKRIERFNG